MRPRQWSKNGFLLAALIFDRKLFLAEPALRVVLGMLLFCLLASAIYIYNDLRDVEQDRQHPQKRLRPIAAGILPFRVAGAAALGFVLLIFPLAWWLSPQFFLATLVYVGLNLAYSNWLKHIPVLDILALASFYVLRVAAGAALIEVSYFSPWLYVFTTFLALFLGVGKRRAELALLAGAATQSRKVLAGYTLPLLDQWTSISATLTILTYSLYTFFAPGLPQNHAMMLTIPFLIYGMFRYMYLMQAEQSGGSPEEVLLSDRPLQATIVLWGGLILTFFYLWGVTGSA